MDWAEYDRRLWHYHFTRSREQEPIRDLQTQLHNMFDESPKRPHEVMLLFADRFNPALRNLRPARQQERREAHWQKMQALGLIPA